MKTKHLNILVVVPYCLGAIWILCHPIISIITGESKCRGVYIDEHQLDPRSYDSPPSSLSFSTLSLLSTSQTNKNDLLSSLMNNSQDGNGLDMCATLDAIQNYEVDGYNDQLAKLAIVLSSPSITCHGELSKFQASESSSSFQVIKLQPHSAPTAPLEALVYIVPAATTASGNTMDLFMVQKSVLFMIARMIEHSSKYLAKTLLFVFCSNDNNNYNGGVQQCTNDFFDSIGSSTTSLKPPIIPSSSFDYSRFIIRQLLVLDIQVSNIEDEQSSLNIIPHGSNGQLPNLDLVTAAIYSFQSVLQNRKKIGKLIQMHSYQTFTLWWKENIVDSYFPKKTRWQDYGDDLGYMFAFMAQSIFRPAPHAKALLNGIDSLTIQAKISSEDNTIGKSIGERIDTILYGIEHLTRGLNSLQELLHHNVNQYIMVSTTKFVSFDEYLIPNILILLPLVIRVILIIFHVNINDKMDRSTTQKYQERKRQRSFRFQFGTFKCIFGSMFVSLCLIVMNQMGHLLPDIPKEDDALQEKGNSVELMINTTAFIAYAIAVQFTGQAFSSLRTIIDEKQSIQLLLCVSTLYMHVPMVLIHVSLASISAMFWVPLVAFPSFYTTGDNIKECEYTKFSYLPSKIMVLLMFPPLLKQILLRVVVNFGDKEHSMTNFVNNAALILRSVNPLTTTYGMLMYAPLHFMLLILHIKST